MNASEQDKNRKQQIILVVCGQCGPGTERRGMRKRVFSLFVKKRIHQYKFIHTHVPYISMYSYMYIYNNIYTHTCAYL